AALPSVPDDDQTESWWNQRRKKPPTHKDYAKFLQGEWLRHLTLIESLVSGEITPEQWGDEFYRLLRDGNALSWMLGRQRGGDYRELQPEDIDAGAILADHDGEYLLRFVDALISQDPRYWDAEAEG